MAKAPSRMQMLGARLGSEKTLEKFKQLVEKGDVAHASGAMFQLRDVAYSRWSTKKAKERAVSKIAELCEAKVPKALYLVALGYIGSGAREMFDAVDALKSVARTDDDALKFLFKVSVRTRFPEVALRATEFFTNANMTPQLVNIVMSRPRLTMDFDDPAAKAAFNTIRQVGSERELRLVSIYAMYALGHLPGDFIAMTLAAQESRGNAPIQ